MLLSMKGITKRFPGVLALDGVDFSIAGGEVHALMGENGAGKSTLIKILTGIYTLDEGEILFDGKPIRPGNSREAQELGISTIYQELNLIPQLSVAENLAIGRQPRKAGMIAWKALYQSAREELSRLGIEVDVRQRLRSCSTAVQQMVAITRAVSMNAKLVIMDEPTSSLGEKEVEVLFGIIRKIKAQGISTVFITHRLDEIFEICDRVTILRDGKLVETRPIEGLDKYALVSSMIGRDAKSVINRKKAYTQDWQTKKLAFQASGIRRGARIRGIDLEIREGEIVGLAGLLGAGRTEFARAVFAADLMEEGAVKIDGVTHRFRVPRQAIRAGIGFVSEDRKIEGIIPHLSVRENLTLAVLTGLTRWGLVQRKREDGLVKTYAERLRIKTPGYEQLICNLSGGNQQKVILARWMAIGPKLLILDEPTRGIDVGAKAEIEQLIQEMAGQGISILFISSEIDELVRNCDRIAVIQDGRRVETLEGESITEQAIMQALSKGREAAAKNGLMGGVNGEA